MTVWRVATLSIILALLPGQLAADAQPRATMPTIGWLLPFSPPSRPLPMLEAFRVGLQELGYVEGQNIAIEYRYAAGKTERLSDLAAELVHLKVDVILSLATQPTLAAKQATSTIPIIFTNVGDPVASGIVTGLARPGRNITGFTPRIFELDAKRLELLKGAVPNVRRVAVLWNPDFPPHRQWLNSVKTAAQALRVDLQLVEFRSFKDFAHAVETSSRGSQALLLMAHPLIVDHAVHLADLTVKSRLPTVAHFREFAEAGGLMAYGANLPDMLRRAATYVDKVLKGTAPGDLPVQQPTSFDLVINLRTAKVLDLRIPESVLIQANAMLE
ncbi:MAG TPA: ABC transporter substrate-binding protein [Methylomirabilota bacterium]|nr:ABC transporter substrate-binding protein [Methylomirabilota bacterium]